jgi:hypothetical protein
MHKRIQNLPDLFNFQLYQSGYLNSMLRPFSRAVIFQRRHINSYIITMILNTDT